jgi:hypothetical protein
MLHHFEELVLEFEAFSVGFDGFGCYGNLKPRIWADIVLS